MKAVTPEQMREIDERAIRHTGVPGIVLMENAALKVVEEIVKYLGDLRGRKILIFAGKGNNGGDAFAAARHLYNKGAAVEVYTLFEIANTSGDAGLNLTILANMGVNITELTGENQADRLGTKLAGADVIVDGMFGTGLKGAITGHAGKIIEMINGSGKYVIAIDIPSGVNGADGKVWGPCIKACKTVTFGFPKIGLLIHPGCDYTGELVVADIGIPLSVTGSLDIKANLTDDYYFAGVIPNRKEESNKGDYGKVLAVCGSTGMTGAAILTARSALRSGAGLVYLAVPDSLVKLCDALVTEAVTIPLEDENCGYLSNRCIPQIESRLEHFSVAAVGPGLTTKGGVSDVVRYIVSNSKIPLVLDADALNAISGDMAILGKLKCEAVITPHPGEMSRLTGINTIDVQNNRIETARGFAAKWGTITVLKGSRTIVAAPDGTVFINPTGNPGMATGGSGDVLTGIIAGLIGQGVKPFDAAAAGVYLHGIAGDMAADIRGLHGMTAGDIAEQLPFALKERRNKFLI